MGIIQELNSILDHRSLSISNESLQKIEMWKAIYSGYYPKWHRVKYYTVDGIRERDMASMSMAKVVAQEMASLIFNERCSISVSDQNFNKLVEDVFEQNRFFSKFQDYLEFMFGLGGMVIKPYVENGKIKFSYVTADCFIPISWNNEGIFEGVFQSQTRKGDKYYTHLEIHLREPEVNGYIIKNELFESDIPGKLGVKADLSILYPDLEPEVVIKNLERPLFVYFKPNIANNIDMTSPLGIPLYANALNTLQSLDIAFDSFQREFRLGKKRILVPATAIRAVPDENGNLVRYFDTNDEIYQAYAATNLEDQKIYDNSVELRVEEHIAAINALLNVLAIQVGFSPGTFTFDGQGVKTATEIVSENSKTFKSKQSHEIIIEQGITDLIGCIKVLADLYGLFPTPDDYKVTVYFDDSIAEDQNAEIDKQIKLVTNRLTSRKRAIMKLHGLTEEEAELLLKEIAEEEKLNVNLDIVDAIPLEGSTLSNTNSQVEEVSSENPELEEDPELEESTEEE